MAIVGAASTSCVSDRDARWVDWVLGGVARPHVSGCAALGIRGSASQRRSPIAARMRGPVAPDARDRARDRASSRRPPRARRAAGARPPRSRAGHPCAGRWLVVPAPSANKDMRLAECQKCGCVLDSSGGHSAVYAWC